MSASSKKKLRKEQNAAQMTEKQQKEQQEAKKLKINTAIFVTVIALILVVGAVTLAFTAFNNSGISERATTALTVGEHKLSGAELGYFYMDAINAAYNDWYEAYGEYTYAYVQMLMGLDMSKPLNEQMYNEEENKTFADMFVDQAVQDAVDTYTIYDMALAAKHTLSEAEIASIDLTIEDISTQAAKQNYLNSSDYLKAMYGKGATEKTFRKYLEVLAMSNSYQLSVYGDMTYEQAEIDAYNDEHFDEFSSFSYCSFYMNANDFLVCTADEGDEEHVHTDEEKAAGLKAAEEAAYKVANSKPANAVTLNKAIKQLDPYKDSENTACTELEDVMYTDITNEDVAAWLTEEGRKVGDCSVVVSANETTDEDGNTVSTPYGYTVVLFLGRNDNEAELINVRHILKKFTGGTADENGTIVYSDDEKAAAKDALEILQSTWLASGGTEDQFADLAIANTEDTGSVSTGGLYSDVYPGQMVEAFNDWCFDDARKDGDYTIIETEYGYHLMYFVGRTGVTYRDSMIEDTLHYDEFEAWYNEAVEAAEYSVHNTSTLRLDMVIMG